MITMEEIVSELDSLTSESLAELAQVIAYLKWRQGPGPVQAAGQTWTYDLVEHFRSATVSAGQDASGMEVRVGEAVCSGEPRMALWEHPPVRGGAIVEYHVPLPATVRNPRLRFWTGIRDGSNLAEGNVVAFRVFVNDWRIWGDTQHARAWRLHEVAMPTLPGDVARIQFVTDGLGNHQWAWSVWGEPRLIGTVAEP